MTAYESQGLLMHIQTGVLLILLLCAWSFHMPLFRSILIFVSRQQWMKQFNH